MTDVRELHDDLHFIRTAVARREGPPPGSAPIYWVWAVYVLVGYALIDLAPRASGLFFLIAGIVGGALSFWLGRRAGMRAGECDRTQVRRTLLHWAGGIVLAVASAIALTAVIPGLRHGSAPGQVIVAMIGLVYFLAGVHFDRNFLWLGPVLIGGGIVVGFVPHYGWTSLGVVIALGLTVPTFFRREPRAGQSPKTTAA